MADKKTKNILYKTIFISSGIILLIFILWLFNAFETLEYITLDSRYTNRIFKKPVI